MTDPAIDALEDAWREGRPPARGRGTVQMIVVRREVGVHESVEQAELDAERGLVGDRWSAGRSPDLERQLTLMCARVVDILCGDRLPWHLAGDNLIVDLDLSDTAVPAGTRLRLGDARIEVSAMPHTGCGKFKRRFGPAALAWVNDPTTRGRRLRGLNAWVVEGGVVRTGDPVIVEP
jgi:MOSC domain-containing protein YiiM